MTYTVVWAADAENELAQLWMACSDRQQVADAADEIERALRTRPSEVGIALENGARVLEVPPIAVDYRVKASDRLVKRHAVWRIPAVN